MEHHQERIAGFGFAVLILGILSIPHPALVWAQQPVSLEEAIEGALSNGPSIAMARADSVIAAGRGRMARAFPNPDVLLDYSESPPQDHFEVEQTLEYPWVRSSRVRAAKAALQVSNHELAATRAAVRYEVGAAYARAAAAQAILLLSERNAHDAEELLHITKSRESSGDASELDVHVAAVFAGQAKNEAFSDSLETITSVLQLQALMGQSTQEVEITLADSLESLTPAVQEVEEPLRLAAAKAQVLSEQANLQWSKRNRLPAPALRGGFETDDPEEGDKLLPTFGMTLSVPLWNRGGGDVDEARGMAARAEAELQLVDRETQAALAIARRERDVARLKVERGREVVHDAERVAELATTAYRDGAYSLPSVLEAQRNARESLRQFINDLQTSRIAEFAFERAQTVGGLGQ